MLGGGLAGSSQEDPRYINFDPLFATSISEVKTGLPPLRHFITQDECATS
jgi:hypothetical protein